jgi:hypothetical protein
MLHDEVLTETVNMLRMLRDDLERIAHPIVMNSLHEAITKIDRTLKKRCPTCGHVPVKND